LGSRSWVQLAKIISDVMFVRSEGNTSGAYNVSLGVIGEAAVSKSLQSLTVVGRGQRPEINFHLPSASTSITSAAGSNIISPLYSSSLPPQLGNVVSRYLAAASPSHWKPLTLLIPEPFSAEKLSLFVPIPRRPWVCRRSLATSRASRMQLTVYLQQLAKQTAFVFVWAQAQNSWLCLLYVLMTDCH